MQNNEVSENVSTFVDGKGEVRKISISVVQFLILLCTAIFAPAIGIQAVTGTIVNATLFLSASILGLGAAFLIAIIPSSVSVLTGLLPATVLPMVPFIVLSNMLLAYVFSRIKEKSYWKAVASASFIKFTILYLVTSFVIKFFVPAKAAAGLAVMMGSVQLFTALSGGVLAYLILKVFRKNEN